jgi:hypothetical protein
VTEDRGDVLEEEELGAALLGDAPDVGPEPSRVGCAESLARGRERLAREARSDEIHTRRQPGSSIEAA